MSKYEHINSVLISLHWSPVQQKILLKLRLIVDKTWNFGHSQYLISTADDYFLEVAPHYCYAMLVRHQVFTSFCWHYKVLSDPAVAEVL